ncbi:FkbM family methyltransferase [Martelella radicis]|uniref:FkbM family methyltransferase n=1 Tax=Martelella radicis TaxID=1397476 RepID=A0A7W6KLD3_9HYPH|nr:FkbM family methyltransferase [Martelella radicis]MBB4123302.1 FkbM family methyltransferase [Martelella radicis]
MISYAQNFEDVMLARLFPQNHRGVYLDIGAADPVYLSVTKHFYDKGWRGVNVEPLPRCQRRLSALRPEDINVQAVVGNANGSCRFYEIADYPENSTALESLARHLEEQGHTIKTHDVPFMRLDEICERFLDGQDIDFMKIDVEGGETELLMSGDWNRYRPRAIVMEAVEVNGTKQVSDEWEHILTDNGYNRVWFDGLNNFYLRNEDIELKKHFVLPPGAFDQIETARYVRKESMGDVFFDDEANIIQQVLDERDTIEADRQAKQAVIDRLTRERDDIDADRQAKQAVIDRLTRDRDDIDADRQAKQAVIDRLVSERDAIDADRHAKQHVIDRLLQEQQYSAGE